MIKLREGVLSRPDVTSEQIRAAMQQAVAEALLEHKAAGRSVVMWDEATQRPVVVTAEKITVPTAEQNGSE